MFTIASPPPPKRKSDPLLFHPQNCHCSFLPNNQILFPTVHPEHGQETLPLPDAAEPKWPRVSLGNTDDDLLSVFSIIRPFVFSAACVYLLQLRPPGNVCGGGGGRGLGSAAVLIGCVLACLEPSLEKSKTRRGGGVRGGQTRRVSSVLPRPLRAQPWLPLNHAAKGHVTAPTLPSCISNRPFSLSSLSSHLNVFRGRKIQKWPPSKKIFF